MAGRTAAEMSRQVALTAVQQDGLALEHAAASHRSDRELVLSAVQQNGLALKYASKAMRMDHDIVLAATKQNGAALQFAAGEFKCAPAHPVQRVLAAALHYTQAELIQWRSGQIKLVADMIDVDGNSLAPAVVRSRGDPPVRRSKRHIEPTDTASRLKKVKLELKESVHRYGELVGQGQEFSKAHGTVFSHLRECFPPGAASPVTWRALGEIDLGKLMELGLTQEDVGAATAWQQGFWLLSPPAEEEAAAGNGWPPFIASWAFKKHVTVGPDGRQEETYSIREQTEVLRVERLMPPQYEGPPRYNEFKMSAAFVQHLRRRYSRTKADRILAYLLEKYEEYERHSGGVGFSGYSVIHKAWNEVENREMSFSEMLALLTAFIGEPAAAAAAAAEAAVETLADEGTGGESEPPSAESASPSANAALKALEPRAPAAPAGVATTPPVVVGHGVVGHNPQAQAAPSNQEVPAGRDTGASARADAQGAEDDYELRRRRAAEAVERAVSGRAQAAELLRHVAEGDWLLANAQEKRVVWQALLKVDSSGKPLRVSYTGGGAPQPHAPAAQADAALDELRPDWRRAPSSSRGSLEDLLEHCGLRLVTRRPFPPPHAAAASSSSA